MRTASPLYFLLPASGGYSWSQVVPHWRIRTGIMQGDPASTTEINLLPASDGWTSMAGRTSWSTAVVRQAEVVLAPKSPARRPTAPRPGPRPRDQVQRQAGELLEHGPRPSVFPRVAPGRPSTWL
jgi:hypothetical protein